MATAAGRQPEGRGPASVANVNTLVLTLDIPRSILKGGQRCENDEPDPCLKRRNCDSGRSQTRGFDMSTYVMSRLLCVRFRELVEAIAAYHPSPWRNSIHCYPLSGGELREAVAAWPTVTLTVCCLPTAAMVEAMAGARWPLPLDPFDCAIDRSYFCELLHSQASSAISLNGPFGVATYSLIRLWAQGSDVPALTQSDIHRLFELLIKNSLPIDARRTVSGWRRRHAFLRCSPSTEDGCPVPAQHRSAPSRGARGCQSWSRSRMAQ